MHRRGHSRFIALSAHAQAARRISHLPPALACAIMCTLKYGYARILHHMRLCVHREEPLSVRVYSLASLQHFLRNRTGASAPTDGTCLVCVLCSPLHSLYKCSISSQAALTEHGRLDIITGNTPWHGPELQLCFSQALPCRPSSPKAPRV